MKRLMSLLIFILMFFDIKTGYSAWDVKLWISATNLTRTDTLYFGFNPQATFCTDSSLGEMEGPLIVPENFSFRFVNPWFKENDSGPKCFGAGRGDLDGSYGVDIRQYYCFGQRDTFKILLQACFSGYPITLRWSSLLAFNLYSLSLKTITSEPEVCPTQRINMHDYSSIAIDCSEIVGVWIFSKFGLEEEETCVVAGVDDFTNLPWTPTLHQNYPNPFNPTTTLSFVIGQSSFVSLNVYNMLGQEVVALLNNKKIVSGEHKITFNASAFSGGVYFYRINVESVDDDGTRRIFTDVKRMLMIK